MYLLSSFSSHNFYVHNDFFVLFLKYNTMASPINKHQTVELLNKLSYIKGLQMFNNLILFLSFHVLDVVKFVSHYRFNIHLNGILYYLI